MTNTSGIASVQDRPRVQPLPFAVYWATLMGWLLIGLAASAYLALNHYRNYADIGYQSFCAISRAINCDTVAQSPYAILWGVPVAVWGIYGYVIFMVGLMFVAWRAAGRQRLWSLLLLLASFMSAVSVVYALISTYKIHSYCIVCILTYIVNFMLLYFTWLIRRRFEMLPLPRSLLEDARFVRRHFKPVLAAAGPLLALGLLLMVFFPAYWSMGRMPMPASLAQGITAEGHPWIGAEQPQLLIVEFTDYLCFQCKKMHYHLRRVVAEHPDKIRLVHRNFPLDHRHNPIVKQPYHMGAGMMALMANYALTRDRFWEMNDLLFRYAGTRQSLSVREVAERSGLEPAILAGALRDPGIVAMLQRDIADGLRLGISATPTYVIDQAVYIGQIPPEILAEVIE